ncbi:MULTISPECIES: hypothetical protein [Streptomyces]|jgi:hypothetical protein|uniref:Uncharacterized protein n=1 Tax=Streptomyces edwardsiae TaxID=3075527 RepID=A0ABU2Q8D9_9ACTN|nr:MULTISPECIES: hypothetical protein [unclassified Streptomyces]MDT0400705.1 hypothetical protein [Streptomyces sp. DSM 41635]
MPTGNSRNSSDNRADLGGAQAGRDISVTQKSSVRNVFKSNKRSIALGTATLAALLAVVAGYLNASPNDSDGTQDGPSKLSGNWATASGDVQTYNTNGTCTGFYYTQGRFLDIGGPMQCTISSTKNDSDRYTLSVVQSPNQNSYELKFTGDDKASVYSPSGQFLYEITRT